MKSIKSAVWVRVIAMICALVLFLMVLLVNMDGIQKAQMDITAAERLTSTSYAAEVAHLNWSAGLSSAIFSGTEFTGSVEDTGCVLGKWLYGEAGTTDAAVLATMAEIQPLHKAIHSSASQVLTLLDRDQAAAIRYYQQNTQADIATLVTKLDLILDRASSLTATGNQEMGTAILLTFVLSMACLLMVIICLFSLVRYVMSRIVRPIIAITKESRALSDGILRFHVDIKGEDELAQLAHALEGSVGEISGYVQDIERAMGQLAKGDFNVKPSKAFLGDFKPIENSITTFLIQISQTITQIEQSASLVSSEASQISAASQSLSQGATEQAASVQELAATIENISRQVEDSAKGAISASKMSQETSSELEVGKQQMERMISAMDDINRASQEIGKIIATIENIAFQTNILALNAAVEAARAGSAGKGFAVVADEVRNLAGKSAEASQNTSALIANSIRSVREGTAIAAETAQSLEKIVASSSQSFALIEHISTAAQTEAEALSQVSEGISQISAVVQLNSATAEESAAASEELSSQSQILKNLVDQFEVLQLPGAAPAAQQNFNHF